MEKEKPNQDLQPVLASVNLVSEDPVRLAYFYRDFFGAVIVEDRGGPARVEIWFGSQDRSTCLVANHLPEKSKSPQPFCQGIELRVADADQEYERLCALGIKPLARPVDLPWGYRYFSVRDPDGNEVDLVAKISRQESSPDD